VSWIVYPAGELGLALEKGEVDAIANSEPIGSMLKTQGKVRNLADQATDLPYSEEYCCAVLGNGKFIAKNPKATAAATRALLKAAKWVETNPAAAAKLSVERKYLASTVDQNTFAISHLRYVPSVEGARTAVRLAAGEMQKAGMLRSDTDLTELVRRSFIDLEGVSDDWLQTLEVEKIAGAQVTPAWLRLQYARYAAQPNPTDVFCGLCIQPAI
jgi:NitT/TauT family transport system substrate-binding protein